MSSPKVVPLMPKRRPELDAADLLDVKALAKRWSWCTDGIYRLTAAELPYIRFGRRRRYRMVDVLAYEERHLNTGH